MYYKKRKKYMLITWGGNNVNWTVIITGLKSTEQITYLNTLPHPSTVHACSLTPVCILECSISRFLNLNTFPHSSHLKTIFSSVFECFAYIWDFSVVTRLNITAQKWHCIIFSSVCISTCFVLLHLLLKIFPQPSMGHFSRLSQIFICVLYNW